MHTSPAGQAISCHIFQEAKGSAEGQTGRFLWMKNLLYRLKATSWCSSICFVGVLALSQCQPAEQTRLPEETLVRIMADLHIAEAATTGLTGFRKDSLLYLYYEQIFDLHGVERADYEHDIRLLSHDEDRMMRMVEEAEALLKEAAGEQ